MDNPIALLPQKVSPDAVQQGAPEALKVGHISIAADIYKMYAGDSDDTKIKTVARWAEAKTCEEFRKECKDALTIADNVDKANGFTPKPDAKGTDKYGPKRKMMASRMSEAKMLFGVNKLAPNILKEKGYWDALEAARSFLKDKGIKWDGEPRPTDARKEELAYNRAMDAAEQAVRDAHPMQPGESWADYKDRIAPLVDEYKEKQDVEKVAEAIRKVAASAGADKFGKALELLFQSKGKEACETLAAKLSELASKMEQAPV